MPGLGDGVIPETDNLGDQVCVDCGYKAPPLLFDDKAAYEAFASGAAQQSKS